jgi:hypothetical protein
MVTIYTDPMIRMEWKKRKTIYKILDFEGEDFNDPLLSLTKWLFSFPPHSNQISVFFFFPYDFLFHLHLSMPN